MLYVFPQARHRPALAFFYPSRVLAYSDLDVMNTKITSHVNNFYSSPSATPIARAKALLSLSSRSLAACLVGHRHIVILIRV